MARTKTYKRQVAAKITTVNRKLRDIERTFGPDSEQYQRYLNATSAALPPDAYTLTDSGRLTIHKDTENIDTLKLGQLKALTKLPTAKRSMDQSKKSLAQNKLRAAGVQSPGAEEIKQEARQISDEEALRELAAKAFIKGEEDKKHKLKYSEEVKADMQKLGAKTYTQLEEIIKRGKAIDERKKKAKEYRQRNKERRAEYQREYRRRNRDEVNRKQREYRQRKATEKRAAQEAAERDRNKNKRWWT